MLVFRETFRVDIECRDTMESFIESHGIKIELPHRHRELVSNS
jgi:hypothetical protein